jgi:tRNA G18 (ribose-2'-O)-methylase SpoU
MMRALDRPPIDLVLVLQDVEDPVNVGSIFRFADALKVKEMILSGITARPPHKLIDKVGRGKDRRVPWRYVESIEDALGELRAKSYFNCAIEIAPTAAPYYSFDYPPRLALVVGHEDHGVTKKALALCDRTIFIPMYGKGASLNVHVALAIVSFHAVHGSREAAPIER